MENMTPDMLLLLVIAADIIIIFAGAWLINRYVRRPA
jgi:hypothetical protein